MNIGHLWQLTESCGPVRRNLDAPINV
jgi:hypothetical protein